MRGLVSLALWVCSCGALPQTEVLCSNTSLCDNSGLAGGDGGSSNTGCRAGGGYSLGGGAWACPGVFSPPASQPSSLCATGHTPCSAAGNANLAACAGLPGYYISQALGMLSRGDMSPSNVQCNMPPGSKDGRLWMGCGNAQTSGVTALPTGMNCDGFGSYFDCRSNGSFSCSATSAYSATSNSNPTNGVLCCGP